MEYPKFSRAGWCLYNWAFSISMFWPVLVYILTYFFLKKSGLYGGLHIVATWFYWLIISPLAIETALNFFFKTHLRFVVLQDQKWMLVFLHSWRIFNCWSKSFGADSLTGIVLIVYWKRCSFIIYLARGYHYLLRSKLMLKTGSHFFPHTKIPYVSHKHSLINYY